MMDIVGPPRAVIIVERDHLLLDGLKSALPPIYVVRAVSEIDQIRDLDTSEIAVLILGPSQSDVTTMGRFGELTKLRPGLGGLLIVDGSSTSMLRLALRAGFSDAIDLRNVESDLVDAVDELWSRLERRLNEASVVKVGSAAKAPVTTVFSPKGGVGKSVVAVNTAVALARRSISTKPVAVVDLDLQFGDVALMLRIQPVNTIVDAAAAGDQLDEVLMSSLMVRHEASKLLVLAGPTTPLAADQIDAKDLLRVLDVLRGMCSHVVIDTAPHLSEIVLQAVSESDDVAFVVSMDVPSVKNARLGLQAFELLQLPLDKVVLVLNRADSKVHLGVKEVERALQMKVAVSLPSEALVPQSVNEGLPAVLASPRSRFAGRIDALVDILVKREEARHES